MEMGTGNTKEWKWAGLVIVPPFECEWLEEEELRFREGGRGCITFEAYADNDVTVVFREQAGSKHYHYRRDNSPNYTIVLGSHRNRRLKIEVDGESVVDVVGKGLLGSSSSRGRGRGSGGFERYWISIYDGLISVGKGGEPGHNAIFQWLDSHPRCKVQYVGLSSWDKHVGYRNIRVLPFSSRQCHDDCQSLDLFLENSDLADLRFVVGSEGRMVPAHRIPFALCSTRPMSLTQGVIRLPSVDYSVLHALLQYMRLIERAVHGVMQVLESELIALSELSEEFGVESLVVQCEQMKDAFKDTSFDGDHKLELMHTNPVHFLRHRPAFSSDIPIDVQKLEHLLQTGEYSDVDVYIEDYGLVARVHKLVLSVWSAPFAKGFIPCILEFYICQMFTNGMSESNCSEVCLKDVSPEAFIAMLHFMYSGRLELDEIHDVGSLLLPLVLLADQFGIHLLQQECCEYLLECLAEVGSLLHPFITIVILGRVGVVLTGSSFFNSHCLHYAKLIEEIDSVCAILQVVASMAACRPLEEACEEYFSKHFDYCTTASTGFRMLEEASFRRILQASVNTARHPELAVTSEERVLDAVLMWATQDDDIHGWEAANEQLKAFGPDIIFGQRLELLNDLLPLIRFPLMPLVLLQKLDLSYLSKQLPVLQQLIREAIQYLNSDASSLSYEQKQLFNSFDLNSQGRLIQFPSRSISFHHRPSSFKELLYICDGDRNGVIYHAGTSYGEHPWMNPVLAKKISVTASSPYSRYTDAKALVSRQYQATSFAGPSVENGRICAWWKVDLGEDHQVATIFFQLDNFANVIRGELLSARGKGRLGSQVNHGTRLGTFEPMLLLESNSNAKRALQTLQHFGVVATFKPIMVFLVTIIRFKYIVG
eukprot:Gb_09011 [translate_table: standard]